MIARVRSTLAVLSLALVGLSVIGEEVSAGEVAAPQATDLVKPYLPDSLSLDGKVVYVDFWASWCVPCRQSFPWIEEQYDLYHKRGFEVVAVNVDTDHEAALKFLEATMATFPVIFDSTGSIAEQLGLQAMPTSYLYGRDGRLVSEHLGFRPEETDSLESVIFQLLEERTSE